MPTSVQSQVFDFISDNAVGFLCSVYFNSGKITKRLWEDVGVGGMDSLDTGGAIAQAVGLCPNEADELAIFGGNFSFPPYSGGQCPFRYSITVRYRRVNGQQTNGFSVNWGPISGFRIVENGGAETGYIQVLSRGYDGAPSASASWDFLNAGNSGGFQGLAAEEILSISVVPQSGEPDVCGNLPGSGTPQKDLPPSEWPDVDPDSLSKDFNLDIDFGELIGTKNVNLPFSNPRIDKLFPIDFDLDVGGISFNFEDGEISDNTEDDKTDAEETEKAENLNEALQTFAELLRQIRDCTCQDSPEVDEVFLARADCSEDHTGIISMESILALRGSVDAAMVSRFNASAQQAKECCENNKPLVNKNAEEIFSGVCTLDNPVVFSPEIGLEVVAVVLEITDVRNKALRYYKLAANQSEAKFGHLGWTSEDFSADSGGPFCWSMETYYSLPKRTKSGRVRISLKPDISFTLWDSGERSSVQNSKVSALSSAEAQRSEASLDSIGS